jgi:hypothetical protein
MKYAMGFALVSGVLLSTSSLSAAPSIDRQGLTAPSSVEFAQYRYERICRRLRRDCMRFDGAGDRADCRRYRRHCTRWWR